jgi:hypothetical protein
VALRPPRRPMVRMSLKCSRRKVDQKIGSSGGKGSIRPGVPVNIGRIQ